MYGARPPSGPLAETMLDHPVAQIEHANNAALGGSNGTAIEAVLYLRTDELATPREARNAAGTVVWSWYSAAFGDTNPAEDPDGNGQRTIVNLRFPGQYADQEAGLHYNGHRSYDPATGRYLESDPIGLRGGLNSFSYVFNRPVSLTDPAGLSPAAAGLCLIPAVGWVSCAVVATGVLIVGGSWWLIGQGLDPLFRTDLLCREQKDVDCEAVLKQCRKKCLDAFASDPNTLPGVGSDYFGRQRRCIRECMEANGCRNF
jgi:RHS repeat-associated protein